MNFTDAVFEVLAKTPTLKELIENNKKDNNKLEIALNFLLSQELNNKQTGGESGIIDYLLLEARYVGDNFTEIVKSLNDKINKVPVTDNGYSQQLSKNINKLVNRILSEMHKIEKNKMPDIFLDLIENGKILEKINVTNTNTIVYIRSKMEMLYKQVQSNPENVATIGIINDKITKTLLPYQNNKLVYPILGIAINIAIKMEKWENAVNIIDKLDKNSPLYKKINPETIEYLRKKSIENNSGMTGGGGGNTLTADVIMLKIQESITNISKRKYGDANFITTNIESIISLLKINIVDKSTVLINNKIKAYYREVINYIINTMNIAQNIKLENNNYSKFFSSMETSVQKLIDDITPVLKIKIYEEVEYDMKTVKDNIITNYRAILRNQLSGFNINDFLRTLANIDIDEQFFIIDCNDDDKDTKIFQYIEKLLNNMYGKLFGSITIGKTANEYEVECRTHMGFFIPNNGTDLASTIGVICGKSCGKDDKWLPVAAPIIVIKSQANLGDTITLPRMRSVNIDEWNIYAQIYKDGGQFKVAYDNFNTINNDDDKWFWYAKKA